MLSFPRSVETPLIKHVSMMMEGGNSSARNQHKAIVTCLDIVSSSGGSGGLMGKSFMKKKIKL